MRRSAGRMAAAVAAGAALSGLVVSGASAAGDGARAARQVAAAAHALAVSGGRLWVARYSGRGNQFNDAAKVAVSPDGRTVYVTGKSAGTNLYHDFATIAYSTATGARLWAARYNGPGNGGDEAQSLAVSPDGRRVYVTGWSAGTIPYQDVATIAYSAATGARLWVARFTAGGAAVAVSPDGGKVYVAGRAITKSGGSDFAVVAYKAATGARLWARLYDGPAHDYDLASSLAVSTAGTLFVTGESRATVAASGDCATIAYSPAGARLWVVRNGAGDAGVAVSPDGRAVYVTGSGRGANSHSDYATVAFKASTGARMWTRRYDGPGHGNDFASSLAVSTAGTVAVTGTSGTIAYNSAGSQLWVSRYTAPGSSFDYAASVAAPGNGKVYVTGTSTRQTSGDDYLTIAYNIFTGAMQWARRYSGPGPDGNNADAARSVAARAGRVFVTGTSEGTTGRYEYATIAYNS